MNSNEELALDQNQGRSSVRPSVRLSHPSTHPPAGSPTHPSVCQSTRPSGRHDVLHACLSRPAAANINLDLLGSSSA